MSTPPGLPRYRPSGRVRVGAALLALLAAVAVGVGIGWIDAAALGALPATIALALPVTLGAAILLALVAGRAARLGHFRSPALAALAGIVLALATDAASFHFARLAYPAALREALMRQDATLTRSDEHRGFHTVDGKTVRVDLLVHPPIPSLAALEAELAGTGFLRERLDVGWSFRSLDRTDVRGPLVIGVWIGEFLLLALGGAFGAAAAARDPYCEPCGRFAVRGAARLVNDVDFRTVRAAVEAGRMATVLELPKDTKAGKAVLLEARACPTCTASAWVDATILPAGARGARPSAAREFLGRITRPFARGGGTNSRVDTHLFDRAIFTSAERDALFPSARRRAADDAPA